MSTFANLYARTAGLRDKLRASPLLALFLIAFIPVFIMNPAKLGLTIYGLAKTGLFGYGGYWCDRILSPYGRPHGLTGIDRGAAEKRRAFIVCAWIVAGALVP